MKYISQLNDDELVELLKPFIWGDFKKIDYVNKEENQIDINLVSECDDDENKGEKMTLEDLFILTDYNVKIYDYMCYDKEKRIREYRQKLLDRFGHKYALDFLLEEYL